MPGEDGSEKLRGDCVELKGEAGELLWERDSGEKDFSTGRSQAGNGLKLERDRAG